MSFFANLNIHCIEHLLTFLSKREIVIFGEAFPDLQEVIDRYWKNLRVLNFNNMTPSDIDAIMKNINLCTNVKELYYTEENEWPGAMSRLILSVVERNSPVLKILDISGIELRGELASILKSCDNLKSLSVKVLSNFVVVYDRDGLFSDKTHLEHLSVIACHEGGIEYDAPNPRNKFGIDLFLQSIVRTVTTLKSFQIIPEYVHVGMWGNGIIDYNEYMLTELLGKNPELVEVTLGQHKMNGECLKSLPMGIKRLDIKECSKINSDTIIRCLRSWNLESLEMDLSNVKCVNFLEDLVAAAPTLKHLALVSGSYNSLRSLEGLKHLKSLRLYKCREPYFLATMGYPISLFTHSETRYPDRIFGEKFPPLKLYDERVFLQFTPSFLAAISREPPRSTFECDVDREGFVYFPQESRVDVGDVVSCTFNCNGEEQLPIAMQPLHFYWE